MIFPSKVDPSKNAVQPLSKNIEINPTSIIPKIVSLPFFG